MISPSQLFLSRPLGMFPDRPATNHRSIIPRNAAFLERSAAARVDPASDGDENW